MHSSQPPCYQQSAHASDSHHPIKVFVGSIPANTDEKDLLHFLLRYATVLSISLAKNKTKTKQNSCKGFGFITCKGEQDFEALLALNSQICYRGRFLTFREFKTGADLQEEISSFNERRLFVGNICPSVQPDDLADVFKQFGPIENVYLVNDEQSKKSKFGYVIMKNIRDADNILEHGPCLYLKGRLLKLEKFNLDIRKNPAAKISKRSPGFSSGGRTLQHIQTQFESARQPKLSLVESSDMQRRAQRPDPASKRSGDPNRPRGFISGDSSLSHSASEGRILACLSAKTKETYLNKTILESVRSSQKQAGNVRFNRIKPNDCGQELSKKTQMLPDCLNQTDLLIIKASVTLRRVHAAEKSLPEQSIQLF
jgi:RNA recognition motif-containing protein